MTKLINLLSYLLPVSLVLQASLVSAQVTNPARFESLSNQTKDQVRARVVPLLDKYCGEACQLIKVDVEIDEEVVAGDDIGFESIVPSSVNSNLIVRKVVSEIQIDQSISIANRDRLENILKNHIRSYSIDSEFIWRGVSMPQIGRSAGIEGQLRDRIENRITRQVNKVIQTYCPEQCVLENILIRGQITTADQVAEIPENQIVRDDSGRSIFRIDGVDIDLTMDENVNPAERSRIGNVLRAKTRFVSPVNLNIGITSFPETYASLQEKKRQEQDDPYGLEKLRRMLVMFRELAGTKEIISTNSSTSKENSSSNNSDKQSSSEANSLASQIGEEISTGELVAYIAGLMVLLTILGIIFFRMHRAKRDADEMMEAARFDDMSDLEDLKSEKNDSSSTSDHAKISLKLKVEELKKELIEIYMDNPKVAKETFSRLLKEDGVEETAKYVHIIGNVVTFELLNDPNMQRDLYQLSEYYHSAEFKLTIEEEFNLLVKLKTKSTASEIRVMTRKSTEKFDFLTRLDSGQVYNLIIDESAQVQSIVLTQLPKKKRLNVFEMYQGEARVKLMTELCQAEAIPKEYLFNVAKALHKKVNSRPEFDTENLRSSDILLDLMEKADLDEQRNLMTSLQSTNPDTARSIKMKLVTVEMLPYLKDGHLLEIILGMDRDDLLAFLMGTRDHVRDMLIRKSPEELADSWLEDMDTMATVDAENYRIAEIKVLGRIRSLANNGVISLLDINDMIFGEVSDEQYAVDTEGTPMLNQNSMVA